MKNELFVTAREAVQELGVSKTFAYKLVPQMNGAVFKTGKGYDPSVLKYPALALSDFKLPK